MLTRHDTGHRVAIRRALTATERLERVAAAGWPAPERAQIGDWLLRAGDGWTARANSALPIGSPGLPLPDAVDAVGRWYADRRLPPAIMVPEPAGKRVTAELAARGWTPAPPVLVQTASLEVAAATRSGAVAADRLGDGPPVRLDRQPPRAWLAVVGSTKRYPATDPPEDDPTEDDAPHAAPERGISSTAWSVITGVARSRFAGVYRPDGSALATARGVVADDGEWLGISLVHVEPSARRRGLATAVTSALAQWAAAERARRAYLQVEERNIAAIRLYTGLGFTTHHRYVTWRSQRRQVKQRRVPRGT